MEALVSGKVWYCALLRHCPKSHRAAADASVHPEGAVLTNFRLHPA